jgi:hypothetical protein
MNNVLTAVRGYVNRHSGGAVGAGFVLVLLPSMTLVYMMDRFRSNPTFGYPILAIFGIMILLGALALVSTLFARLQLSAPDEALALPPGSIRATIALSLIVLFALLAVMLYQSLTGPEKVLIKGLNDAARQQLLADPSNTDIRVVPVPCTLALGGAAAPAASDGRAASAAGPSAPADPCAGGALFKYDIEIGHAVGGAAVDFAKQLLTLIGTLMTSVVSFYFAAKSSETVLARAIEGLRPTAPDTLGASPAADGEQDHEHGGITVPTEDKDLPPATGGALCTPPQQPAVSST